MTFCVLLRNGGALEPEFEAITETINLNREITYGSGIIERLANIIGLHDFAKKKALSRIKKQLIYYKISLIYSNTATNGEALAWLNDLNIPIISHIHELEYWLRNKIDKSALAQLFYYTDFFIAGAEIVKNNLIQNHNITPDSIETVYEFIPMSDHRDIDIIKTKKRIRSHLRIPDNALMVGAAGTTDWRKGCDLFVQLARLTYKCAPELKIHFLWIGGERDGPVIKEITHDLVNLELDNVVHFIGAQTNYLDYIASLDVFTLMSREDCFPLVVLEAAMFNKPIICFDKAGGASEFIENDSGFIVPYLDLEKMTQRLVTLLTDTNLQKAFGSCAADKVVKRHNVDLIAPRIFQIIQNLL